MAEELSPLQKLFGGGQFTYVEPEPPEPPEKLEPKFEDVTFYGPNGYQYKPNPPWYFATQDTANAVLKRLEKILPVHRRPKGIQRRIYEGNGGPYYSVPATYWSVEFEGWFFPAGVFAAYYERAPEDQFPNVSDSLVRSLVETGFRERGL